MAKNISRKPSHDGNGFKTVIEARLARLSTKTDQNMVLEARLAHPSTTELLDLFSAASNSISAIMTPWERFSLHADNTTMVTTYDLDICQYCST